MLRAGNDGQNQQKKNNIIRGVFFWSLGGDSYSEIFVLSWPGAYSKYRCYVISSLLSSLRHELCVHPPTLSSLLVNWEDVGMAASWRFPSNFFPKFAGGDTGNVCVSACLPACTRVCLKERARPSSSLAEDLLYCTQIWCLQTNWWVMGPPANMMYPPISSSA